MTEVAHEFDAMYLYCFCPPTSADFSHETVTQCVCVLILTRLGTYTYNEHLFV